MGASGVAETAAGESPKSLKKDSCSVFSTLSAPAACSVNMMIQSSRGAWAAARASARAKSRR